MNVKKTTTLVVATLASVLIGGCSRELPKEEISVVSEANCKPENIAKISDSSVREEFASKCFHRGQFKPSPKKEW